jgi:hypothetical protein
MRPAAVFAAALIFAPPALAQNFGNIPPNSVLGNVTSTARPAVPVPLAQIPGAGITPQSFGAVGNGIANDTAAIQAALNAAVSGGVPLFFDGAHKYLITSPITSNSSTPAVVQGIGGLSVYTTACPHGIIVNSNIDAFSFAGTGGSISGMCIQMAATAGTRTSGAAIKAGSVVGTTPAPGQGHFSIINNTVINAYDGIVIGGNTTGGGAAPTQTNANVVRDNIIISASHEAVSQGKQSTGISTNGTIYSNNQIACFSAAATAVGYALYDGDFELNAANGGPYNCNIGVKITPGANQGFNGSFMTGVLGDTVGDVALLIDSTSSSSLGVNSIVATNWWAATQTTTGAGGGAVRIQDSGGGTRVHSISLTSGVIVTCTAGGGGAHDITGIKVKDDVYDVLIANNRIYPACLSVGGTGIEIDTVGYAGTSRINIIGNNFDTSGGTLATGLKIGSTTDTIHVSGNIIAAAATTPITWTPGPNTRGVVKDNVSDLTNGFPAITAAAAITAPFNEAFIINGTTTVTTMANMWSNREVWISPGSVFTIATTGTTGSGPGAGGKFCNGMTTTVSVPIIAKWTIGSQCWLLKS